MNSLVHRQCFPAVPPDYAPHSTARRDLVMVGADPAWESRYQPALRTLRQMGSIDRIAHVGRKLRSKSTGIDHYLCADSGMHFPVERLAAAGYLTGQTLCVIATPPASHAELALQALSLDPAVRVACEKPLSNRGYEARRLALEDLPIIPLDHKLTTSGFFKTWNQFNDHPDGLARVRFLRGDFFEREAFAPGRTADQTLRDTAVHLLNALVALARTRSGGFWIEIESCAVAHHKAPSSSAAPAAHPTAVQITGHAGWPDAACLRFELNQAKAAALTFKQLALYDCHPGCNRAPLHVADLGESGWRPHSRALCLLVQPQVKLPLTLPDAIRVISLLNVCERMQQEWEPYAAGTLPQFIPPARHEALLRAAA